MKSAHHRKHCLVTDLFSIWQQFVIVNLIYFFHRQLWTFSVFLFIFNKDLFILLLSLSRNRGRGSKLLLTETFDSKIAQPFKTNIKILKNQRISFWQVFIVNQLCAKANAFQTGLKNFVFSDAGRWKKLGVPVVKGEDRICPGWNRGNCLPPPVPASLYLTVHKAKLF